MAAVRAVQRSHQLQRVERVLAQHEAWRRSGLQLEGDAETIEILSGMRDQLLADVLAEGQTSQNVLNLVQAEQCKSPYSV